MRQIRLRKRKTTKLARIIPLTPGLIIPLEHNEHADYCKPLHAALIYVTSR